MISRFYDHFNFEGLDTKIRADNCVTVETAVKIREELSATIEPTCCVLYKINLFGMENTTEAIACLLYDMLVINTHWTLVTQICPGIVV